MNKRLTAVFVPMLGLLGCSTPPPEPALVAVEPPPPEVSVELPLEPPAVGHICKLGESCLELDPRPFEACLVGTKHCVDKAVEPLLVDGPKARDQKPGVISTSHKNEKKE